MSTKTKAGNWALPPTNTNAQGRPLTGRVIFGMLTGEGPDQPSKTDVVSEKPRR